MTDVVFAFGPDGYFFESQTQWRMKNLPYRLAARFSSGSTDIAHVHQLVLGSGESWFMSYRTKLGGASFAHDGLPEKLAAWLRVKDANGYSVRNIPKLKVTLGPYNASFWAEDGNDYFWDNLPGPLQMSLEKLKAPDGGWNRAPKIVILGVNQSYVMISEGGGGSYAVSDYYPWLEKELVALIKSGRPGALKMIHHISVDQHDGQNFVMMLKDGQVFYYVPDQLSADMAAIRATIPKIPAAYWDGREAETASNPMPVSQSVSVPSGGPDPNRSPEEFAQNPTVAAHIAANTGTHLVQSVQQRQSTDPVEYSAGPAPPYTAQTPVSPQSTGHRVSVSGPSQQTLAGQRRVSSPQSMSQHPQVAVLEQAAATARIPSPAQSMTQSQYSHEVLQHHVGGMTQRIMSPAPIVEEPAVVSHASSGIVSPNPGHHQRLNNSTLQGAPSVSPQFVATSSNPPSGRASVAQNPGSPSPITQTSASPVYALQGQVQQNMGQQSSQPQAAAMINPTQSPQLQANAHAQQANIGAGQAVYPQADSQSQIQVLQHGGAASGVQPTTQSLPSPPALPLSPDPLGSSPPVPNPTPIDYNVRIGGSPATSLVGSQISQSSIQAPVPVMHSPGSTPSRADVIPIPTTSTPAPQSVGQQAQPQLVSVQSTPVGTASSVNSLASAPTGLAEVSASPPPQRQSFASPAHSVQLHRISSQQVTPITEDPTTLPGAVPFMPPAASRSPIQYSTSPPMTPGFMQSQITGNNTASAHLQRATSPLSSPPQLVQVASAPAQHVVSVPGQPHLVRIVSSPGPVQQASNSGTVQMVSAPGGHQIVQQRLAQVGPPPTQIHQTQQTQVVQAASPPATPAAGTAAGSSTAVPSTQAGTSAEQKKKQQQNNQGQRLATAFGIGLAKGAVRAIISS